MRGSSRSRARNDTRGGRGLCLNARVLHGNATGISRCGRDKLVPPSYLSPSVDVGRDELVSSVCRNLLLERLEAGEHFFGFGERFERDTIANGEEAIP